MGVTPYEATPRREHPRAGLHPRPSPAELWKSLWKNSFSEALEGSDIKLIGACFSINRASVLQP